ncbi:MAG: class II aldolase/adducin family protein [Chloroflexi bacterium]|nr:class II aldolase/adducin family protein [Chloroflexota bacterium]
MSDQIETLKLLLCQGGRIVTHKGLNECFGHLSARIPGEEKFLITTRGALAFVQPEHIEEVDFAGNKLTKRSKEGAPNELFLHAEVYKARPDVSAIARTQSKWCEIFGVRQESVRPVHSLGAILMGEAPVFDVPILGDVQVIGQGMVKQLGDRNAILLRGNGNVVLGRSVPEAVVRACFLDESAWLQLQARSLGESGVRYFDEEEVAILGRDLSRPDRIERAWDNWLNLASVSMQRVGQVSVDS